MEYAPIALFVYARPDHTFRTVEALKKNPLAEQSDLIIFSDAPKSSNDIDLVKAVRSYIHQITGFKSIKIVEQAENRGLANSIISGVTQLIREHGRIIVLEDDMVTSPYFLEYMNDALVKYQNEKKIWHISGWNYPISSDGLEDVFFWRLMNCWGWATWADRWEFFEKKPEKLIANWSKKKINRFNLDSAFNAWGQVKDNYSGKRNTWAIFWYATIFEHSGLCLNPTKSLVENIGHDGSGENCNESDIYLQSSLSTGPIKLPAVIVESVEATKIIKKFYKETKPSFLKRFLSYIKKTTIYNEI